MRIQSVVVSFLKAPRWDRTGGYIGDDPFFYRIIQEMGELFDGKNLALPDEPPEG
jgi:hypothetical protein